MEDLALTELDAPGHFDDQAQALVLRTIAAHADALLRTARRHSLCADDAHDAYQRALEIFMRRASRLDAERAPRWLHVVVKHEAMAVRRGRLELVGGEEVDFDRQEAPNVPSPEEQAVSAERVTRAAEALQRLKPQELQAMWLRAMGNSYDEICDQTGWSFTKVNRCLTEGRKSFLERYAGIESGEECERWAPLLSAIVDGEATAEQLREARPHLRRCAACRGTLRELRESGTALAAVFPAGVAVLAAGGGVSDVHAPGLLSRVYETVATFLGERSTASALKVQALLDASGAGKVAAVAASAAMAGGSVVVAGKAVGEPHGAAHHAPAPAARAQRATHAPKAPPPIAVPAARATAPMPGARTSAPARRRRRAPRRAGAASSHGTQIRREFATARTTTSTEFSTARATTSAAPTPSPAPSPPGPRTPTRSTPPPMNGGEFDP